MDALDISPSVVVDETSKASRDDAGLAEFTAALTSSDPASFRSTSLWKAPVAQFEAKQQAPAFVRDSWARWHRENRAGAKYDAIAEADQRRKFSRAAVVRPIHDGCVGTRKRQQSSINLQQPSSTTAQQSPIVRSAVTASLTPLIRTPANDPLQHPEATPTLSCVTPQKDVPTLYKTNARLLDPIPITPRTYRRVAKLSAPDTFMEGVSLIANILDSHYRLRSLQEDEVRHRRSVAYVTGKRLDALKAECHSGRQEHLASFLRLMQRVQSSERGPLDIVQVAQWYDGFVGCALLSSPPDEAAQHESTAVEAAYLGLSVSDAIDADHPITWLEYLISPQRQPDSVAAKSMKSAVRTEVLLPISALRAACMMRSIPLITKSTWDGHHTESTFLECLHRQLPNARHHLDNAVVQLMQVGVMPRPRWIVELFHTFTVGGAPLEALPHSKKWLLTSNVVHGALGMLHVKEDHQRRRSSVSTRGLRTPPSSLGNRRSTIAQPHNSHSGEESPSSTLHSSPSPQTLSLHHKHGDQELTAEGLARMLKSVNTPDGAEDESMNPVASTGESCLLSVEEVNEDSSGGNDVGDELSGGVLSPLLVASAPPAVMALVRKYDVDGSGGLSCGEFLACAWSEKSLRAQGRW